MKSTLKIILFTVFVAGLAWQFSPNKETRNRLWVHTGLAAAKPYKRAVENYWQSHAVFPSAADLAEASVTTQKIPDKAAVKSITFDANKTGRITITFTTKNRENVPAALEGAIVTLTPQAPTVSAQAPNAKTQFKWTCETTLAEKLRPKICR
jgi:hypothetical protein